MKENTYSEIIEFLAYLGVPSHVKGYNYLVSILNSEEDILNMSCMEIYRYVARVCNTNQQNVDRGIRHVVKMSFENMPLDVRGKIFGNSLKGRILPTNSQYIHSLLMAYKYMRKE